MSMVKGQIWCTNRRLACVPKIRFGPGRVILVGGGSIIWSRGGQRHVPKKRDTSDHEVPELVLRLNKLDTSV